MTPTSTEIGGLGFILALLALAQRLGGWEHKLIAKCLGLAGAGLLVAWCFLFLPTWCGWVSAAVVWSIFLWFVFSWTQKRAGRSETAHETLLDGPDSAESGQQIPAKPYLILEYNPEVSPGFELFNTSTLDALNVEIPAITKPPFLVKCEAQPNAVPARTRRRVKMSAYHRSTWEKISDNPEEIIKTVWKDELGSVERSSMTPLQSSQLEIDIGFDYENLAKDKFGTNCRVIFNLLTEQITTVCSPRNQTSH
jgi:hypothetical protein